MAVLSVVTFAIVAVFAANDVEAFRRYYPGQMMMNPNAGGPMAMNPAMMYSGQMRPAFAPQGSMEFEQAGMEEPGEMMMPVGAGGPVAAPAGYMMPAGMAGMAPGEEAAPGVSGESMQEMQQAMGDPQQGAMQQQQFQADPMQEMAQGGGVAAPLDGQISPAQARQLLLGLLDTALRGNPGTEMEE